MKTAAVDGFRIAYRREGIGPPLVLLHGFICDSRAWDPQIETLSKDFDVIAWDAPGCGQSSDPPEDFTMAQFAGCLAGFLDAISVPAAHLVGLSLGGTIALEFYRLHPNRVLSLVLADTYAGWTGSLGEKAAAERLERCLRESEMPAQEWIPQWVPHAFSASAPQQMLKEYETIMWDFHPVGFRAMSRAVAPDFRGILLTINVPTLLIWGAEDRRSPVSVAHDMCDSIPGARLVVIPEAGHLSNFEQPVRFNTEVIQFCSSVETERVKR